MARRKRANRDKPKRRRRPPCQAKQSGATASPAAKQATPQLSSWSDDSGVHAMLPIEPDAAMWQRMTELYQQNIRNSPLWDQMVDEFGLEKAEQLLKEFRARPG